MPCPGRFTHSLGMAEVISCCAALKLSGSSARTEAGVSDSTRAARSRIALRTASQRGPRRSSIEAQASVRQKRLAQVTTTRHLNIARDSLGCFVPLAITIRSAGTIVKGRTEELPTSPCRRAEDRQEVPGRQLPDGNHSGEHVRDQEDRSCAERRPQCPSHHASPAQDCPDRRHGSACSDHRDGSNHQPDG